MPLSQPRSYYGIHTATPYSRTDGSFFGVLRVLGEGTLNLSSDLVPLNGGSNKFDWHVEDGLTSAEISLTMREYPDFVYEIFLGKAPTSNSAEASGNVGTPTNKLGTSMVDATTGIASAAASTASDLKTGRIVLIAVSATTFDAYYSSNIDFNVGTDLDFQDDTLKVTASALTLPGTGGTVIIPDTGVELTGGSGSIALTIGDTCVIDVRAINTGSSIVKVGGLADITPEFGMMLYAKKRGNFELIEFDIFRCKSGGFGVPLSENTWAESAVTLRAIYDSAQDGLYQARFVKGSA